jgi:hypothetical protein
MRTFRLQSIRASQTEMRRDSRPAVPQKAAVIENFLEFGGSFFARWRMQHGKRK